MVLNEKLKDFRNSKGLSQEQVAELVGVSRQAVAKWEGGQSTPSSDNLIALASIYGTSLDELAQTKSIENKSADKVRQSNLALIAIIFQAAALNVCIQPILAVEYGLPYIFILAYKFIPLMACSIWMAFNLRFEKNKAQYNKNTKIELLYCTLQLCVTSFAFYSKLLFLGTGFIIAIALFYIFIINPKYMHRVLVKKKRI